MSDTVPGDNGHELGRNALEPLEQVRVYAHLEDRGRLDPPRELGVGDVVAPGTEIRRSVITADQEVGVTSPVAIEERGLEDDIGAGSHGGQRLRLCFAKLRRRLEVTGRDLQNIPTLGPKSSDVCLLVGVAALLDQGELRIIPERLVPQPMGSFELQRDEVVALEEPDEIGRGDDERPVFMSLHWCPL